jgi:Reverse transcriptase (RNA-dependent DNA polymerase)
LVTAVWASQHSADRAQQGVHAMTAMPKPQMDTLLRPGTCHMELCEPEVAEGLADAGVRDGRRRHPVRAQAVREKRQATLATLQALVAQHNHDLKEQPRAAAPGAWQQLVARATTFRLADGVELTLEARASTLTVHARGQQEAAQRDGGSGLKTDLTPAQAPKEMVHDRDKALAAVARACRSCKTVPLARRPIFLRLEESTRAHAFVVMLASQIIRDLASCWSACDVTVAAGLQALTTLCLVEVAPPNAPSSPCIPTPRAAVAPWLHSADITLPKAFSLSGTRVSTKKKLPSERLVRWMQLLPWLLALWLGGKDALEQAIGNFPARGLSKQWLKAGYVEAEMLHPTEAGVPQGGVISPLLLNVALHGMEQALGIAYTPRGVRRGTYALVRYADDLVIFSPTHEKAVEAQHLLSTWLGTRGLRLSGEKTHIRHLRNGPDKNQAAIAP